MSAELPNGWALTTLETIAHWGSGGTPSRTKPELYGGTIPWFKTGELGPKEIFNSEETITHEALKASSAKLFPQGSVVVAMYGATIGKVSILGREAATNQACAVGIPMEEATSSGYLYNFLRSQKEAFVAAGQGGAQPNISQTVIKAWPIPIAPVAEQKRIADKLDTVLSRVDAVSARLARVAPLLKRFRQSVLAAATSGRLTEDWRGSRKATYPKLPMAEIADMRLGKMLDKAKNTGAAVRYLRNVNVRWFSFDLSDVLELRIEEHERDGLSIMDGDLLVCEGGEPGRCAVWQGGPTDLIFQKALHRVRPDASVALSTWIAYVLKHLCDSGEITSFLTGSTIKHLTGRALAKVPVPIPSLDEQAEIVRRVDVLFAFADRLEARLNAAQTATGRLTPALLAKAFRGELVPQDPDDEPASELLRRLQATSDHRAPARAAGRGRKRSI